VQLGAEDPGGDLASRLATRPEIRIIRTMPTWSCWPSSTSGFS